MPKDYVELREGNFYVAGTRVSLDSIVHAFRRGDSAETICQSFEVLELEEVYGAIAYYLGHQSEIDPYLLTKEEKWLEGKRSAPGMAADLRKRLQREPSVDFRTAQDAGCVISRISKSSPSRRAITESWLLMTWARCLLTFIRFCTRGIRVRASF